MNSVNPTSGGTTTTPERPKQPPAREEPAADGVPAESKSAAPKKNNSRALDSLRPGSAPGRGPMPPPSDRSAPARVPGGFAGAQPGFGKAKALGNKILNTQDPRVSSQMHASGLSKEQINARNIVYRGSGKGSLEKGKEFSFYQDRKGKMNFASKVNQFETSGGMNDTNDKVNNISLAKGQDLQDLRRAYQTMAKDRERHGGVASHQTAERMRYELGVAGALGRAKFGGESAGQIDKITQDLDKIRSGKFEGGADRAKEAIAKHRETLNSIIGSNQDFAKELLNNEISALEKAAEGDAPGPNEQGDGESVDSKKGLQTKAKELRKVFNGAEEGSNYSDMLGEARGDIAKTLDQYNSEISKTEAHDRQEAQSSLQKIKDFNLGRVKNSDLKNDLADIQKLAAKAPEDLTEREASKLRRGFEAINKIEKQEAEAKAKAEKQKQEAEAKEKALKEAEAKKKKEAEKSREADKSQESSPPSFITDAMKKKLEQGYRIHKVGADWCDPCKAMQPDVDAINQEIIKEVGRQYKITQHTANGYQNRSTGDVFAQRNNVSSLPTILILSPQNREVGRLEGKKERADIKNFLKDKLS